MPDEKNPNPLSAYAGRWIARLWGRIVGQGGTPQQALQAAKAARRKETPEISYVPTHSKLQFPELIQQVQDAVTHKHPVYLVGGAVRDVILGQDPKHDLDFATGKTPLKLARRVADRLKGAYYCMDKETETGRVVLTDEDGVRTELDFTLLRGGSLESDLRERDFTINAMAVDLKDPQQLLDPLGGLNDLHSKTLRVCGPNSITNDPVRVLRAVRFAAWLDMRLDPETRELVRAGVPLLGAPSIERIRDELLKILGVPRVAASIRVLDRIGALEFLLPELLELKGVEQSPPHTSDVWDHTLHTVSHLEKLINLLDQHYQHDNEGGGDLVSGLVSLRLGRYREHFTQHLTTKLIPDRDYRPIIFLAALYHDAGKPTTRSEEDGRIRFLKHEKVGADLAAKRAAHLRLSNTETDRLKAIIRHHMRPLLLANEDQPPSRRAIYRFFRAAGDAGPGIALLAIADMLATHGSALPHEELTKLTDVLRALLEAYWEQPEESVSPPPLLNGRDLIKTYELKPGPQIGLLLEALREAQAAGEVQTVGDAYKFAEEWLNG